MMRHLFRSLLASTALSFLGSAQAQDPLTTLNYEDADLKAVAVEISNRTKYQFVLDPRLSGRVNIISPPGVGLTAEEMFEVFLATLQVNNYTAIPVGDRIYKIVPIEQGVRDGSTTDAMPMLGGTVTEILPLENLDARQAASSLRGIVGQQGLIVPIIESNALVVVDTGRNIERVREVIKTIDVDDTVVRAVALDSADAGQVATTLKDLSKSGAGEGRQGGQVEILANPSTNQVLLRGSPRQIQRLLPIIEELDRAGGVRGNFDVIYLNHADGADLVPIVTELITGRATAVNPGGGGGGGAAPRPQAGLNPNDPIVTFHEPTNAILVNAPLETQKTIRGLVSQLDIRRPQVLIEAIVVEIANNTARELGVQYLSGGESVPITAATFTDTQPNLLSAAGAAFFLTEDDGTREGVVFDANGNPISTEVDDVDEDVAAISGQLVTAAVSDLLAFNGFLTGFGTVTDDGSVFGVLLSAIQSDSRSNVLSTPFATTLDNKPARLSVGQEIPIVTGEAVGTDFQGGFRNIERQEVGNILEVTPQINYGNTVTLEVKLEISSLTAFTGDSQSPIVQKSVIENNVQVDSGSTVILGGLVDNDQRNSQSKVPILGDIPLLGWLFRGETRSNEETTLMIFIRPTILHDAATADAVTAKKYNFASGRQLSADRRAKGASRMEVLAEELLGLPEGFTPTDPVAPALEELP